MAEIDQIAKDIVVAWLSHTNVPFDFEEPAQTGPTPLLRWWGIKPGAPRSKPRHNFVYLSADLSQPYRFIVTPQICICGLSPSGSLVLPLCGGVAGEAGLA
jgi:hypothetical protein